MRSRHTGDGAKKFLAHFLYAKVMLGDTIFNITISATFEPRSRISFV